VELGDRAQRRRRGAWYTPPEVVAGVCELTGIGPGDVVVDPACGDGRFLAEAARRGARARGVELDRATARAARAGGLDVVAGDALTCAWPEAVADVVVGNPPFLNQLAASTTRGGRSPHGGGPYADAAVEFLALARRLVRPGGRIGLVLPASVLAARDAAPVRDAIAAEDAVRHVWWLGAVFDAAVDTVVVVVERGGAPGPVSRWVGAGRAPVPGAAAPSPSRSWSALVADLLGIPPDPDLDGPPLGDRAAVTADFRDQYYGLRGAVDDDLDDELDDDPDDGVDGPPLVTAGLLDPGRCAWGARPCRVLGATYRRPRVAVDRLTPAMRAWAARRLVPKVLVATQTTVLEAAPDPAGAWLPSVPVLSVVPTATGDVWPLAAALTSPAASAWVAHRCAGTGLSAGALRPTARLLATLPLPTRPWDDAVDALRRGDVLACGRAVDAAYQAAGPDADTGAGEERWSWWSVAVERALSGSGPRRRRR
jgi:SAM-dependent methyltransferase